MMTCKVFPDQLTREMVAGFKADIGGSTRPHHGFIDGNEFVLKCGSYSRTSSDAHVHNEYVADCLLREAGCHVPESREYRADIGNGKIETLRLSRFIKGRSLGQAMRDADPKGQRKIREEVARTYPVLSFLSAIDTYQHIDYDANVLVDDEYKLWFIDNGASFEFSAMGGTGAKPWYWNRTDVLGENGFFALRDAKGVCGYYQPELRELLKGVADEQLRQEASRYDFVKLAQSLPDDFLRGKQLTYAENMNAWAQGAVGVGKKVVGNACGQAVSDRIKIVTGKIERAVADAIVNAANSVHIGGGGIDGAIHRAAGPRLAKACSEFERNERGEWCPTGEARTTSAFDIKSAKYIIHTAGPDCRGGYSEERNGVELASCYRSVLNEAAKHGCKTVSIPSISTGIFGFPLEDAARIATATVAEFLKKNSEMEVTFVMWDGDGKGDTACGLYRKALAEYTALSFSKKELDGFHWLFYHGEEKCPIRKEGPFDMLWTVERHIKTHMRINDVKKQYIDSYARIPRCIFGADASPTVKALVYCIYIGCDTFAPAHGIAKIYFRQLLKISDLRFRFYAGEERCPERFVNDNEKRWWHQESTVKGEQAIRDFVERAMSDWPCAVMCSTNDDGERAVALSGYLNTNQWGEEVAGDFNGYFEYPVNDYRLDGCQKECQKEKEKV